MKNSYTIPEYLFFITILITLTLSVLFLGCSNKSEANKNKNISFVQSSENDNLLNNIKATQEIDPDSLKKLLNTTPHDKIRLRFLDELAKVSDDDDTIITYNNKIDSLAQKILDSDSSAITRNLCYKYMANALHREADIITYQGEFTRALELFNKSLELKEKINDKRGIAASLINMGNIQYYQGDITKALEYYHRSLKISEGINDKTGVSRALNNIGAMHSAQYEDKIALEYYKKSLKIDQEAGNKKRIAYTLNNIGLIYSNEGDMQKALEYYNRSLKISEELDDKTGISRALSNIGIIYDYQKDYSTALEYYFRSVKVQEELGDKTEIAATLTNIGNVYADIANEITWKDIHKTDSLRNKALEYYFKGLEICENIGDKITITATLINIGDTYEEQAATLANRDALRSDSLQNKALKCYFRSLTISEETGDQSSASSALSKIGDIYLSRNEISKAYRYAKKAYEIANETGYMFIVRDAALSLEKIYARQGNYKLSRQYFGEYIALRDSIIKEENQQIVQKKYYQYQYEKKAATDSIEHSKEMEISRLEIEKQKAESKRQKLIIGFVVVGLLFVSGIAIYIFRSLHTTRKQKIIIEDQKKLVEEKNVILNDQNEEIRAQKEQIESIHVALTDSIHYAQRIQKAVLPSNEYINQIIAESNLSTKNYFILYKPRDIVSGDFYFFNKKNGKLFMAAADCTGHGVPGAFMSMLGLSFLNQIVLREHTSASEILDELRVNIIQSLKQRGIEGEQQDGLDISFVLYDIKSKTLQYSGANNPLYYISSKTNELTVVKPDRMPVAIYDEMKPFTNNKIKLQKGDILYMASDGYQDQFGGPQGKKYYSKYLKQLLIEICGKSMKEQRDILDKTIEDWKNAYGEKYQQTDDITIMGIKIT